VSAPAESSCLIPVRAVPNASKSVVIGWQADGRLKVKVAAVPEGGRANKAVEELLAGALDLPKRSVSVEKGETAREKMVRVNGLTLEAVKARLNAAAE
jgi:uncharacterized protein YggU (UPF0235/DUF167 family)